MATILARLIDLIPFVGDRLGPYRKIVVAVATLAVAAVVYFVGETNEWVLLAIQALGAAGVYQTPNASSPGQGVDGQPLP